MPGSIAQSERQALCSLLEDRGPLAPTLCEGWTTADLAAHLYVRERKPLAAPASSCDNSLRSRSGRWRQPSGIWATAASSPASARGHRCRYASSMPR